MYEQPFSAFCGMTPSAYYVLVDRCVDLDETEDRQKFAQSVTHTPDEYQVFMESVQSRRVIDGDRREERLDRLSDAHLEKLLVAEMAQQKKARLEREALGLAELAPVNGADFLLGDDDEASAIWGDGDEVLLADGEALMLVGGPGVGKTTVANQFLRARLGITDKALGYTVKPSESKVLYLACDRPRQWRRAAKRILLGEHAEVLKDRLEVWKGPPPEDFAQNTDALLNLCLKYGADTVIIDSLKDVALGLSEDAVGAGYNRARQHALNNGITILELHHQVKRGQNGAAPNTLADVYGSTWITAGAGSVAVFDGEAGDPVVKFRHLKQPMSAIGPLDLYHDHDTGESWFAEKTDLVALASRTAITSLDAAKVLFDTDKPTKPQKETARRRLEKLVRYGKLRSVTGGVGSATVYAPMSAPEWTPSAALENAPQPSWDAQQLD